MKVNNKQSIGFHVVWHPLLPHTLRQCAKPKEFDRGVGSSSLNLKIILECLVQVDMEASVVDLSYHMKDVLQALEWNEEVKVLHRGKLKGTIVPATSEKKCILVQEHPLFGCQPKSRKTVETIMDELRGPRYRDI